MGPPNLFWVGILIFLSVRSPCKILEPYNKTTLSGILVMVRFGVVIFRFRVVIFWFCEILGPFESLLDYCMSGCDKRLCKLE